MNTLSQDGRHSLIELPEIESYSTTELEQAAHAWPAIQRYLEILKKSGQSPSDQLRLKRHRFWLNSALATYFDKASAEDVCLYWSRCADQLIAEAWSLSGLESAGYCALALGKLGAEELNLSSDVDLILVRSDSSSLDLKGFRKFQELLADWTEFGYCLRLDFTLRPGGRSSAAVSSLSEFEYHYGYHGEMWERLAYVRMRGLLGPTNLLESLKSFSIKFSFRKHLDYTLLDDLKALRSKIRQERLESRTNSFHLKLGEGGIRELELFVHALQVIHGGRNRDLQTRSTTQALKKIKALNLLPKEECEFLHEAYWYLRTLENKLHAFEDQQNYVVDLKDLHPALPSNYPQRLFEVTEKVKTIATSLFGDLPSDAGFSSGIDEQQEWLRSKGFSKTSINETWPELLSATALSRRSEQDEQARMIFLRGFIEKLSEARLDQDLGLSLLLDFVKSIRAKASFFTLLNRETEFRDTLALLFSMSPYLGSVLASRPELIDEFVLQKQAAPPTDLNSLLDELAERRLLAELIAANQFLTKRNLSALNTNLTKNADEICLLLLNSLKSEYGASDLNLLPMGKWGGRELGLRSDLDFLFVCPNPPTATDHKIAKRFLSRITEPHRGGCIYSVDVRLRPSGNAGPILVTQNDLRDYIQNTAAAWERQAYLRSRPLTPLNFHPAEVATQRGLSSFDKTALTSIRGQLFVPSNLHELDLKLNFGGLADIEFTTQIALLERKEFSLDPSTSSMIQYLESRDPRWSEIGPDLRGAYQELREIEQLFQLTTSLSGSKMRVKSDEFKRLALVLNQDPASLEALVRKIFAKAVTALGRVQVLDHQA